MKKIFDIKFRRKRVESRKNRQLLSKIEENPVHGLKANIYTFNNFINPWGLEKGQNQMILSAFSAQEVSEKG